MTIYMLAKLSKEEKQKKKWFLFGYLFILILCSVFAHAKYDHSVIPVESFTNQQMLINVDKRDLELTKENKRFYKKHTEKFTNISSDFSLSNLNKKTGYLYVGRITCEFCRSFIRYTAYTNQKIDQPIFYIDTDRLTFQEKQIMYAKLKISGVPSFFKIKKGSYTRFQGNTIADFNYFVQGK